MHHLSYFILLALLAEILGTIGGFGSSLFFVPIASYFLDFQSVLGITAVFHVSSNISKIALFRKGIDKHLMIYLGIPAVISVIIGAIISKYVNVKMLEIVLALFLSVLSILLLVFRNFQLKPSRFNSVSGGLLSGFIAGLIGTGGAIRGIVLSTYNLSTDVFIATSAVIDLGIDASRSVVYFLNGYVHRDDLYLLPILFVVSFVGTLIGKQILKKFSQAQFKTIVLLLIMITGFVTLYKWM